MVDLWFGERFWACLWCVDFSQGLDVLGYHVQGQFCLAQMDFLHGLSVVRAPWVGCLDAMAKVVFHAVEHDGCVVDGINVRAREREGPLDYVRSWSLSSVMVRI